MDFMQLFQNSICISIYSLKTNGTHQKEKRWSQPAEWIRGKKKVSLLNATCP